MSGLARLRDLFRPDREPEEALFCTYGFDARFFESEILPAAFPISLSLDRDSGSEEAYLHSADELLARRPVSVFYDHLADEGPELNYGARRFDVGGRAFHPKLIVLDYGEEIRVAIGSANLTRPAWTSLLEIFATETLVPGKTHPWAQGLRTFVDRLGTIVPPEQPEMPLLSRLAEVKDGEGGSRVASSFEGPLLEAFLAGFDGATRIDAVSPFFEGAEGEGVFDRLRKELGPVKGRLFTGTTVAEGGADQISGPPEKLRELFDVDHWELHAVAETWDGDEDGAPPRSLHGKLLALRGSDRARVMSGSANLTRAALLRAVPQGNVELVVIDDCDPRTVRDALPQARRLDPGEVEIEERGDPTGEDAEPPPGPERHVASATYLVKEHSLELGLQEGAPTLRVRYDGRLLDCRRAGGGLHTKLELGIPRYVTVDDGTASAIVPFVIVGLSGLAPRGRSGSVALEEFLEILAGNRESSSPADDGGDGRAAPGSEGAVGALPPMVGGAIPWRRILAAIAGLGRELERELAVPRGIEFTIENPSRLAGFLGRLEEAHESAPHRFAAADLAYALYETEREVRRVQEFDGALESITLLAAVMTELADRRRQVEAGLGAGVVDQLATLAAADR
jgi:hypothetical protein